MSPIFFQLFFDCLRISKLESFCNFNKPETFFFFFFLAQVLALFILWGNSFIWPVHMGLHLMGAKFISPLAGKCSHPHWLILYQILCPLWSQRQSNLKAGAVLRGWRIPCPTLSLAPLSWGRRGKGQAQTSIHSFLFLSNVSKLKLPFSCCLCILLFSYSKSPFPTFSNYPPNKGPAVNRYQHRNPKGSRKEQV